MLQKNNKYKDIRTQTGLKSAGSFLHFTYNNPKKKIRRGHNRWFLKKQSTMTVIMLKDSGSVDEEKGRVKKHSRLLFMVEHCQEAGSAMHNHKQMLSCL
jgi:hypothetical protein